MLFMIDVASFFPIFELLNNLNKNRRLREYLVSMGEWDNTHMIFSSDHGSVQWTFL